MQIHRIIFNFKLHIVCQLENIIQFYCHEVNICSGAQSADLIWIFQTKWNIIVLSNIMNKWKVTLIKSSVEPVHRSNPNKQNLIITNRITSEQLPVLFTHLYIRHAACLQPFIFYFMFLCSGVKSFTLTVTAPQIHKMNPVWEALWTVRKWIFNQQHATTTSMSTRS